MLLQGVLLIVPEGSRAGIILREGGYPSFYLNLNLCLPPSTLSGEGVDFGGVFFELG